MTDKNDTADDAQHDAVGVTDDKKLHTVKIVDQGEPREWEMLVDGVRVDRVIKYSVSTDGPNQRPTVHAVARASRFDFLGQARLVVTRVPLEAGTRDLALTLAHGVLSRSTTGEQQREMASDLVRNLRADESVRSVRDLNTTVERVRAWQAVTFPRGSIGGVAAHLQKEAKEIAGAAAHLATVIGTVADEMREPGKVINPEAIKADPRVVDAREALKVELADAFFLLVAGFDLIGAEMADAVDKKLAVNKTRRWGEPDNDGVIEHVKEVSDA